MAVNKCWTTGWSPAQPATRRATVSLASLTTSLASLTSRLLAEGAARRDERGRAVASGTVAGCGATAVGEEAGLFRRDLDPLTDSVWRLRDRALARAEIVAHIGVNPFRSEIFDPS